MLTARAFDLQELAQLIPHCLSAKGISLYITFEKLQDSLIHSQQPETWENEQSLVEQSRMSGSIIKRIMEKSPMSDQTSTWARSRAMNSNRMLAECNIEARLHALELTRAYQQPCVTHPRASLPHVLFFLRVFKTTQYQT